MMRIGSDGPLRVASSGNGKDVFDADVGKDFQEWYPSRSSLT
jgi:hypothetical protein